MIRQLLCSATQIVFCFYAGAAFSSPAPNTSSLLSKRMSNCVGSFQAAKVLGSYVEGFATANDTSERALTILLPAIGVSDPKPYVDDISKARQEFHDILIADPLDARAKIRQLMKDCSVYAGQSQSFSNRINAREAAAVAERVAEQNARLQAEKDALAEKFKRERIALDIEKLKAEAEHLRQKEIAENAEIQRLTLETEKAKAEADRLRQEEETKSRDFERQKELVLLSEQKNQRAPHPPQHTVAKPPSTNEISSHGNAAIAPTQASFSNAPEIKPSGRIDYTNYKDGSCKSSGQKQCINQNEMASMCSGVTTHATGLYSQVGALIPVVRLLYENQGKAAIKKAKVSVDDGVCTFSFRIAGTLKGTDYDKTFACRVSTISDDMKGEDDSRYVSNLSVGSCTES